MSGLDSNPLLVPHDVNRTIDCNTTSNTVAQEEEELNKEFYGDNYQARNETAPTLVSFLILI